LIINPSNHYGNIDVSESRVLRISILKCGVPDYVNEYIYDWEIRTFEKYEPGDAMFQALPSGVYRDQLKRITDEELQVSVGDIILNGSTLSVSKMVPDKIYVVSVSVAMKDDLSFTNSVICLYIIF